jgi:hypothetical protein
MRGASSRYTPGRPITRRGRLLLSGCLLLVAIILGFAASTALYQFNRGLFRVSPVIGYLLCGAGQRVDDVPTSPHGRRMICRNADGEDISARNNLIAAKMALPFFVLIAVPGLWFAWRADLRMVRGD